MPIGYRFCPTDEELVVHYLTRKNLRLPLPASVIPEFDVFQTSPWGFPGDLEENRYFFSNVNGNGSKRKRVPCSGSWKPSGKERLILASGSNQPIGIKKTLVFSNGKKQSHGPNTKWLMHQYCLLDSTRAQIFSLMGSLGDWCIYSVFQKNSKTNKHGVISRPSFIDFTVEDCSGFGSPPQPSSSSSSSNNVVEDSSNGVDSLGSPSHSQK